MNAKVARMSWTFARTDASASRASKRHARYSSVTAKEISIAMTALRRSSAPTRGDTASVRSTVGVLSVNSVRSAAVMLWAAVSAPAAAASSRSRAHDDEVGRAEGLHLGAAESGAGHRRANAFDVGCRRELVLHGRPAGELDAHFEALVDPLREPERQDPDERGQEERGHHHGDDAPPLDGIELGVLEDAKHQMLSVFCSRDRESHRRKRVRTTKTELNIDETTPATSVTAKPCTGPVPYW